MLWNKIASLQACGNAQYRLSLAQVSSRSEEALNHPAKNVFARLRGSGRKGLMGVHGIVTQFFSYLIKRTIVGRLVLLQDLFKGEK